MFSFEKHRLSQITRVLQEKLEKLDAVSEIVLNVLKGILPYKPPNIKFARHKEYLRFIGNPKKNSARKRKNALVSKGRGVIVPLLSAAIPILIDMFSK